MQDLKDKVILVVDDEPDLASVVEDILYQTNAKIIVKNNGEEALAVLKSGEKIDFIISDVQMPFMTGVELLIEIKRLGFKVPVCLVSGFTRTSESEILKLGAYAYLSKPFSSEAVLKVVHQVFADNTPIHKTATFKEHGSIIYILDDEPLDHDLLKRSFLQHDFSGKIKLEFFMTGEKLLTHLRSQTEKPDLIIFDVNLPGISGLDTLEVIKREDLVRTQTRHIILSSTSISNDQERAKKLGADCLYRKPVNINAWWHLGRAIYQSWIHKDT